MRPNTGVFTAILLTAMTLAQPQVGVAQETQTKETAPVSGSEIDDNTARVILQFLLTNKQEDLTALATAESIDDLTAEQKQKLLDLAKSAATYMRQNNSTMFAD